MDNIDLTNAKVNEDGTISASQTLSKDDLTTYITQLQTVISESNTSIGIAQKTIADTQPKLDAANALLAQLNNVSL